MLNVAAFSCCSSTIFFLPTAVSSKDAQPQVSLLLGGKALSVQWKTSEKLFSELQASGQGIPRDSSRFMGYSDTMQEMKKAGVVATDGFFRGPPQIIQLGVECTGNPKVKKRPVLTNEKVFYKGKDHVQFNSMYVCTLKVAGDRHGITAQPKRGDIVDFGFLWHPLAFLWRSFCIPWSFLAFLGLTR